MTPQHLRQVGEALYGERWQTPLAASLGVADRTVRRWLAGTTQIPAGVPAELARLLTEHAVELRMLAAGIRKAA